MCIRDRLGIAAFLWVRRSPAEHVSSVPAATETDSENGVISLDNASAPADDSLEGVIAQAKLLADGYDYDGAINLLSSSTYASDESVTACLLYTSRCQPEIDTLIDCQVIFWIDAIFL